MKIWKEKVKRTSIAINVSDYNKLKQAKEVYEEFAGNKMSWGKFLSDLSVAILIGLKLPEK